MKHYPCYLVTLFLVALSFASCKKDPKTSTPSEAEFYFQAKIDGQDVAIEFLPTNNVELSSSNDGSIDPPYCNYSYGAFIGPAEVADGPIAGIDLNQFFIGDCGNEQAVFNNLFPTGNYPLGNPLSFSKNVEVKFSDDSGFYRSNIGPQSGAKFTITDSQAANDAFGLSQTISGTFQCTVWDDFGGQKVLTDGVFKLPFRR